jgi:hypothetical protein
VLLLLLPAMKNCLLSISISPIGRFAPAAK